MPAYGPAKKMKTLNEWIDKQSRKLFITPAVLLILVFSVFPLIASLVISFTRVRPRAGGYNMRFVGFRNFKKIFFGSEQYHLLGTFEAISGLGWCLILVMLFALLWWLYSYIKKDFKLIGFIGRVISAAFIFSVTILFSVTLFSGNNFGTLPMTIIYVIFGCSIQFLIGLGLAYICSMNLKGRTFFRILFFMPLMITPVGIAYQWRMLADMNRGPLSGIWQSFGFGDLAWGSLAWPARTIIMIADAWMWIPFIFIVLVAALDTVSKDLVEAADVDGAGKWLIFKDVIWPQIAPVAGTVVLIRWIEGFKLVDIPLVMTSGGPGISTETLTMHSWTQWRALDFGGSSAVAYTLLFVTVIICVSFFNFVIRKYSQANQL